MIGGEHDDNIVAPHTIGEPLQEPAEIAIEAQHLIMDLPGIGAERVTDGVRRRETHGEQVRAFASEAQRFEPLEGKQQCQRIHGGHAGHGRGREHAVSGKPMRENDVRPAVFPHFVVRFLVRAVGKQERPRRVRRLERQPSGVERLYPRRQRVSVVAARGE